MFMQSLKGEKVRIFPYFTICKFQIKIADRRKKHGSRPLSVVCRNVCPYYKHIPTIDFYMLYYLNYISHETYCQPKTNKISVRKTVI